MNVRFLVLTFLENNSTSNECSFVLTFLENNSTSNECSLVLNTYKTIPSQMNVPLF